jgi:hypothetical protein
MSRENPTEPRFAEVPEGAGLPQHHRHPHRLRTHLDVIAVISNPVRYRSRYDLYRAFEAYVSHSGARLTTVELAYGQRPFEVTDPDNPRHVQLRTGHELWHKENLINLGIQRLPRNWEYVAWVDADVRFANPQWVQETLQELQHYQVVQLFSHAQDLGPRHEPLASPQRLHVQLPLRAASRARGTPPGTRATPGPPAGTRSRTWAGLIDVPDPRAPGTGTWPPP